MASRAVLAAACAPPDEERARLRRWGSGVEEGGEDAFTRVEREGREKWKEVRNTEMMARTVDGCLMDRPFRSPNIRPVGL